MNDTPILMYHNISDTNNPWCVSPSEFEKQMAELAEQGYRTTSLDHIKTAPNKSVIITFDDARGGVFKHALPILKKHNFTATVYIVPEWINGNIPESERYSDFMSWEQINKLKNAGWTLGSHSLSHQNLTSIDKEELTKQLTEAQKIIKEKTNTKPIHFSYPFGSFNEKIIEEVQKIYTTAVTTRQDFNKTAHALGRQAILNNTTNESFKMLLHKPTLAVCMIVKNEEKKLPHCLSSIQKLADEIIITDTGSTDNTKEIAKNFTDKIFTVPWENDFSAARNESLKHATTDWVLILDADEALDSDAHHTIKEAMNRWDTLGYQMVTRNYSTQTTMTGWQPALQPDPLNINPPGWFPSVKTRLFQRKPEILFAGKVHEIVDNTIPKKKRNFIPVAVHHYGSLYEVSEEKRKEYIKLTKKKTEENPADAKAWAELGIQYKELQQYEDAEHALKKSLEINDARTPRLNLAVVQQKQEKIDDAIINYNNILGENQHHADAHFGLGYCHYKKGEMQKAVDHFRKAIKNNPALVDAYVNLGAIYERSEYYEQAVKILHRALSIVPTHARAYFNLAVAHEKTKNLKAARACYANAHNFGYPKRDVIKERIEKINQFLEQDKNYMAG